MSEIFLEVLDILNKTLSNMPWSGLAVLFAISIIIRILDGGKLPKIPNISREDEEEFEWVMVRRRRR